MVDSSPEVNVETNERQRFSNKSKALKGEEKNELRSELSIAEILYDGYYYDVTKFLPKHPGGTIIKFYTESKDDATCAIQQFHKRSTDKVLGIMNCFKRRPANGTNAQVTKNKKLNEDFLKFYKQLDDEGMFKPHFKHVAIRIAEPLFLFALSLYFNLFYTGSYGKALSVIFFVLTQMRVGWLQHEGGHNSLTGIPPADKFIQLIGITLILGSSSNWWNRNHSMHHAMPNRFHRDHDLDTLPIVAYNKIVAQKPNAGKNFFVQNQAYLFLPITNFLAYIAWIIYLHPKYTIQKKGWSVLALMGVHWVFVYNFYGLIPYLIGMWFHSNYYNFNFSISHTHLPVNDQEELHWVEYAFLHSTDVDPSWWCDWWMGYLNYQIEHHLFPTMPQFRGPIIRERVKKFAEDHNLPYHCTPYWGACKQMLYNLKKVSKEVKNL